MEARVEDGPCGGPTSVSKKMIFERIAAYEASFGRNATGTRMAKFLSYLSEPEKEVLRLMNLDRVTDPDRLEQIRVEEEGRQTYFGEAYVPYRNLTLFTYKTPAFATGWVKEADVSDLTVEAAAVLMQKVTDAAMHADVFTGYNNSSAEVEMLRQQVRDLERAAGQQQRQPRDQTQPPEHRFNGVCNNCNGYGHLARDCTATRRPDSSGKGSGRGGHQGVQPTGRGGHQGVQPAGKGGGGKGDAGGRGRGRAVAAVNNSAPGPHGPNLTDAQFDKWLLTQRP